MSEVFEGIIGDSSRWKFRFRNIWAEVDILKSYAHISKVVLENNEVKNEYPYVSDAGIFAVTT